MFDLVLKSFPGQTSERALPFCFFVFKFLHFLLTRFLFSTVFSFKTTSPPREMSLYCDCATTN